MTRKCDSDDTPTLCTYTCPYGGDPVEVRCSRGTWSASEVNLPCKGKSSNADLQFYFFNVLNLECKEADAPAAPEGTSRKCETSKCTYTCDNDSSKTASTTCNPKTGAWDPTAIKISCPCNDPPAAPAGTTSSPDVKKPVEPGTVITYTCPIDGSEVKTECQASGKYSVEKIDLPCIGQ